MQAPTHCGVLRWPNLRATRPGGRPSPLWWSRPAGDAASALQIRSRGRVSACSTTRNPMGAGPLPIHAKRSVAKTARHSEVNENGKQANCEIQSGTTGGQVAGRGAAAPLFVAEHRQRSARLGDLRLRENTQESAAAIRPGTLMGDPHGRHDDRANGRTERASLPRCSVARGPATSAGVSGVRRKNRPERRAGNRSHSRVVMRAIAASGRC